MSDQLWASATTHPFLDAVRGGTLTDEAFDRWLCQDAIFVADLLTFQARLLARAPRAAQQTIVGGCAALVAELDWFEAKAHERGIDLAQPPLPATLAYRKLLQGLDREPYDAAVTALWVIERVYLLAWTHAHSGTSRFREYSEHWSTPEFVHYVDALTALAAPEDNAALVDTVLSLEVDFWEMAGA